MAVVKWHSDLSVQINIIDDQHKKLFDLINAFYENIQLGSTREQMLELIKGLREYTVYHFSAEENYLKMFRYPHFEVHKEEHEKFIQKVSKFEERYKSGTLILSLEVTGFIKTWITDHIKVTDKKYSQFLNQRGIK